MPVFTFLLIILPAIVFASDSKPRPTPFLWSIEKDGATNYLFGTIHVPDTRLSALPFTAQRAFDKADAVYTEIPMDNDTMMQAMTLMFLPGDETLTSILPADVMEALKQEMEHIAPGVGVYPFSKFKVWALAASLPTLEFQLKSPQLLPIDQVIYTDAVKAGNQVGGLETMEMQVGYYEELTREEEIDLLRMTLEVMREERKEGRNYTELILTAYFDGDTDTLEKFIMMMDDKNPALNKKLQEILIDKRNVYMADRIEALMKEDQDKSFFFAVGAGHMLPEGGVQQLLKKRGFTVKRKR